jgi:hypothetical protein
MPPVAQPTLEPSSVRRTAEGHTDNGQHKARVVARYLTWVILLAHTRNFGRQRRRLSLAVGARQRHSATVAAGEPFYLSIGRIQAQTNSLATSLSVLFYVISPRLCLLFRRWPWRMPFNAL